MPTITSKKPLGSLFGGKIASINYSFQSSSQPSSCTITIVSEDNSFQTPKFNSVISIPPFGISMKVVETKETDSTKYKVLQVELVEAVSEVLDNELVLVYGVNTDVYADLNNDLYLDFKSYYIDDQYWASGIAKGSSVYFPTFYENHRILGNGLNVLGRSRATFKEDNTSSLGQGGAFKSDPEWITFDNGVINTNVTNHRSYSSFSYSPSISDRISVDYGYSLKDLLGLMKRHGVGINPKSESLLLDDDLLFKDSGTIRDVLTSCLAKIGRAFYIDPITQRINIVTNSDVVRINNNLSREYSSFENVAGATQISLTKSIKDLSASHFTVKGNLQFSSAQQGGGSESPPKRKDVFYKLQATSLLGDIDQNEADLIKRVMPLIYEGVTDDTIDLYLYGLGLSYDTANWGDLYGIDQYRPLAFEKKAREWPYIDAVLAGSWQAVAHGEYDNHDFIYFEPESTVGAREIIAKPSEAKDGKTTKRMAISASQHGYLEDLKDYGTLWGGVYFSSAMSEKEANERVYNANASGNTTLDFEKASGSARIGTTPSLKFLFRILKGTKGAKTTYTVEEIAKKAGASISAAESSFNAADLQAPVVDDKYYFIATRKSFQGGSAEFLKEDYQKIINENFFVLSDAEAKSKWLLYTKDAPAAISKIERESIKAFAAERDNQKDKLTTSYIKTSSSVEGGESQETEEEPEPLFIKNVPSKIKNFAKRDVKMIQSGFSESKRFLQRMNDINPQFAGPLITTTISYFRPPTLADFDMEKGLDSLSVSMAESGITTTIKYSSRKFAQIDKSVAADFLGRGTVNYPSISSAIKSYQQIALDNNRSGN